MRASTEEKKALDDRLPSVYNQLRRIAQSMLGRQANATLSATVVVHEAYARLAVSGKIPNVTETSFRRAASHVMREVLIDAARRKMTDKRGNDAVRVPLDDRMQDTQLSAELITLVDEFLCHLKAASPRQALVVELLFFGGLSLPEIADELEISVSTAERDWRTARAFLTSKAGHSVTKA